MLHPSTKKLIDKLSEMTRKQRISWIEGENGTVVHDTEGYRVVLTPEPHGVILTDAVGREIETCSPEEIADEKDAAGRPYSQFIGEMFREAHRDARGAEKAIRTLLAGLEAADARPQAAIAAPEPEPEPEPAPEPETLTDETTSLDGETAITAAVATLADQINNTAPMAGPEVSAALEPDVVAADAEAAPLPAAYAETVDASEPDTEEAIETAVSPEAEAAPEADIEPGPEADVAATEPEPEPTPAPSPMQQRFSLSGIPYGVGFAGTQAIAPPEEKPLETAPPEPRTLVIDGTEDLPESMPSLGDEPEMPPLPERQGEDGDENGPPAIPRRFNPWN